MKKFLSIIILVLLTVSLSACSFNFNVKKTGSSWEFPLINTTTNESFNLKFENDKVYKFTQPSSIDGYLFDITDSNSNPVMGVGFSIYTIDEAKTIAGDNTIENTDKSVAFIYNGIYHRLEEITPTTVIIYQAKDNISEKEAHALANSFTITPQTTTSSSTQEEVNPEPSEPVINTQSESSTVEDFRINYTLPGTYKEYSKDDNYISFIDDDSNMIFVSRYETSESESDYLDYNVKSYNGEYVTYGTTYGVQYYSDGYYSFAFYRAGYAYRIWAENLSDVTAFVTSIK